MFADTVCIVEASREELHVTPEVYDAMAALALWGLTKRKPFAFALIFYAATFFLIQFRVEHFIYKRVKKIYDDVSLLDSSTLRSQPVTTDMATLMNEVQKFAKDKKIAKEWENK